jgi:hypothetical protein
VEFRDGQRARSISPWRLALNVAAFFFALSFVTDFRIASLSPQDHSGTMESMVDTAARQAKVDRVTMTERLDRRFNTIYTLLVIVSVASYSLLIRLAHIRCKEPWTVHIVFALHLVAWTFVASLIYYLATRSLGLSAAISMDATTPAATVALFVLILLWQLIYVILAFRRVYADRWFGASAKAVVLVFVGLIVDKAVIMVSFWLSVATVLHSA